MKFSRKKMIDFLISLAVFYVALCVFMYFHQRNIMYYPNTTRPDTGNTGAEISHVKTGDGLELEGWYFPARDKNKPVILYFHGNGGHFADRYFKIVPFLENGYGVLLAEYRGYGGNPGNISEQGFYQDGRAYINFLQKEKSIQPSQLVLYGESIGTGVAVRMAYEHDVFALVLESPYTSIADIARRQYFFLPVSLLVRDKFPNIELIGQIKAPKLIIHGQLDQIIPIQFGRRLYEAAADPKTFVSLDSGSHNDLFEHGAALQVLQFLSTISPTGKD